jgi:hypothetical protein
VCVPDARNENVLVGIRDGVLDTFDLIWRPQVPPSNLPNPIVVNFFCLSVTDGLFVQTAFNAH